MELFNNANGKPTIAVNPAQVSHAILRMNSVSISIYVDGHCAPELEIVRPLDGETLDEAWARLTNPLVQVRRCGCVERV